MTRAMREMRIDAAAEAAKADKLEVGADVHGAIAALEVVLGDENKAEVAVESDEEDSAALSAELADTRCRIEKLDRDRIAHIGHITKLGERITELENGAIYKGLQITEIAKAIQRINEERDCCE